MKTTTLAALCILASSAAAQPCRSIVRFTTDLGTFDVSLLDADAPITVTNFLRYVDDLRYQGSFIHRSVPAFVIQGGGYRYSDAAGLSTVPAYAPIINEFSFAHGNVQATMAMATLSGNPNSATSQFFINLLDNSPNLNYQNGGFAVFGEVTAGWPVVQTIAQVPTYNQAALHPALSDLPLLTPPPVHQSILVDFSVSVIQRCGCYVNCDASTAPPILNIMDFSCFLTRFAAGSPYANCDGSTAAPVLNVQDFSCFVNRFSQGCP